MIVATLIRPTNVRVEHKCWLHQELAAWLEAVEFARTILAPDESWEVYVTEDGVPLADGNAYAVFGQDRALV